MGEVIMAIGGLAAKSPAPRRARELADGKREAINDGEVGIRGDLLTDPLPETVLHRFEIRRLANKGRPVKVTQRRDEVAILAPKVGKDRRIVRSTEVLADDFHCQDFTLGQGGKWPALAQAVPSEDGLQPLVNQTKPGDNQIIQVHGAASFELMNVLARRRAARGPESLLRKTRTSG
jgi:hypothetical protein